MLIGSCNSMLCPFHVFRYGQLPAVLNYSVMMQSIASKIGHSRSIDSKGGINHHADHHTLHRKNFGFGT